MIGHEEEIALRGSFLAGALAQCCSGPERRAFQLIARETLVSCYTDYQGEMVRLLYPNLIRILMHICLFVL